jgi:hypothetical protein
MFRQIAIPVLRCTKNIFCLKDPKRIRISIDVRSNGWYSRSMVVVAGKNSGRKPGRTVAYMLGAITSGIVYLSYGGAIARQEARVVKRDWMKLRDEMEVEVGSAL